MKGFSTFLIALALIAGMVGCGEIATPTQYNLTIAVTPVGSGTAADLTSTSPYAAGTVVSLRAVANLGYQFVDWTAAAGTFADANAAQTTFTMPAQNVVVTANFEAEQVVVFDFVAEASSNSTFWESGAGATGEEAGDWALTFGDFRWNSRGWARYGTDYVLEDNYTYERVLDTNPQWVYDGFIRGWYGGLMDMGYRIEAGDRFYAKVGFFKDFAAGNVTFMVWIIREGFGVVTVAEVPDTYDATLKTIDVDLSPYATDLNFTFILGVLANGSSGHEGAAWVEAKIIR